MKRLLRAVKFLVVTAVFVLLVMLALWPKSAAVDIARVERGGLTITLDEEGKTRVRERFVVSAPVSGRVQRIELEPGDRVVRNRTEVAIFTPADPVPLDVRSRTETEENVKSAEAGLGRARAERDSAAAVGRHARSELARMRALYEKDVTSQQALSSAENEARTAEEALRAAEFAVSGAEHELARARARLLSASRPGEINQPVVLRAPVTGVVLKRLHESEAIVPAGEPLLELGDPEQLEIVSDFLSTDAVRIRPGNPVWIERWGGDATLQGQVRRIEPAGFMKISALGVEEQRVSVLIDFDDPFEAWKRLGDGYRVEVQVVVRQEKDVLKTPVSSLFRSGEDWAVFAVENGRARRRSVEVGPRNDSEAQVLKGLSEVDVVIVHPSDSIRDGSRVTPREAN